MDDEDFGCAVIVAIVLLIVIIAGSAITYCHFNSDVEIDKYNDVAQWVKEDARLGPTLKDVMAKGHLTASGYNTIKAKREELKTQAESEEKTARDKAVREEVKKLAEKSDTH
jgi:hypothetical protein